MPFLRSILLCLLLFAASAAHAVPHLVVDLKSGKVLSQEQAFDRWYPASLTKLMTAYTVFREIKKGRLSLASPVMMTANASREAPSRIGLPVGTILTVDSAIKILMVKSANDLATAIAESVSGSEASFVALMNGYARELGMTGSRFANAHGLHDAGQYTTARDLALLVTAIRTEFPDYSGYFSIRAIHVGGRNIANHNQLLFRFDGATGMKTGFICAAGMNVIVTAKRHGRELVAVVLGGSSGQERNVRAARLLSDNFLKSSFLATTKLETMKPVGAVNNAGTDMRDVVCKPRGARKKQEARKKEEDRRTLQLAFSADLDGDEEGGSEPSLAELERKYLGPRVRSVSASQTVKVALGDATGPDPYGLIAEGERLTEIRKAAEAAAAKKAAERRAARKKAAAAKKKKK